MYACIQMYTTCLQALTVFAVDVGPHMHMDTELVAEALRTHFLSKVRILHHFLFFLSCWRVLRVETACRL